MTRAFLVATLAAILLVFQPVLPQRLADGIFSAVAWADEDDDDGGSDDDDDDDDGGGFFGRDDDDDDGWSRPSGPGGGGGLLETLFGTQRQPATPPPAPAPPPPSAAPDEIVTLALDEADLNTLLARGFTVIEELPLPGFDTVSRRLRIPQDLTLADARSTARALPSGQDADFNHFYRPEQVEEDSCTGPDCPDSVLRDWPHGLPRDIVCGPGAPIGMIDTGINEDHETFEGARLEVTRLGRDELEPSRAIHGTAVAALLVGQPGTRAPGLVPETRLVAIDAFHRVGGDERADVFSLIEGLDLLASEGVSVINLSLAGPPNSVLEEVVERLLSENDILLVASVGNAGPAAEPAYPAAFAPVIAVTAVDRGGRVYRRAVRGAHVDLAAPGVEVWTAASVSGARWKTGTSFAVPFVSAAAALLRADRPDLGAAQVADELRLRALDLGDPGRDEVFGAGLVGLDALCVGAR
jgi:minor extracellular protease Epr